LGERVRRYTIVDLSGSLRERQQQPWPPRRPGNGPPNRRRFSGVVVGNEVLDAMPVQLLARVGGSGTSAAAVQRPTGVGRPPHRLRPPLDIEARTTT
jgi:SAM-dependent MidA family methyltransferase